MAADHLWLRFLLAALATWRVTHLIVREDGPWNVIVRIRRRAGAGFWGELMDCFHCCSLWVSAVFAFALRPGLEGWILSWLALSAAACLLDRIGRDPVVIQGAGVQTQGGSENAVLRTEPGTGEDGAANPYPAGDR